MSMKPVPADSSNPSVPLAHQLASLDAEGWSENALLFDRGEQSSENRSRQTRSYHIHIALPRRNS